VLVGFGCVCIGGAGFNGGFCLSGVFQRQWVAGFCLGRSRRFGFFCWVLLGFLWWVVDNMVVVVVAMVDSFWVFFVLMWFVLCGGGGGKAVAGCCEFLWRKF